MSRKRGRLPQEPTCSPRWRTFKQERQKTGASYGGRRSAILVNLPGEASSVIACLDGYAMARQGRAGRALAIPAIGSFVAGMLGTLLIVLFAPLLARVALTFGPADYFSLMLLGLVGSAR